MIGCPVIMVEAPLSQKHYKHPQTGKGISMETLELNRAKYVKEVIDAMAHPSLRYTDMADIVGYDSRYLVDQYPTRAPWHLSNIAIQKVTRYFMKTIIAGKDSMVPLSL